MKNIQKEYRDTDAAVDTITRSYKHVANASLNEETPAMMLNYSGIITDCNWACARLLGYPQTQVIQQHISKFLPQIQETVLFKDHHLNPHLRFLSRIGHHFQAVRCNGAFFASQIFFVELGNTCESFIRVIIRPIELETAYS